MMINKPNRYRVLYKVMEGNNYAGGWGNRHTDVLTLSDVARFDHVQAVYPLFIEVGETPITTEVIEKAITEHKDAEVRQQKLDNIARAEETLRKAKAAL